MKEALISSSVLILALLGLRFLFRRTISRRVQYALWLLVLLRLLLPFSLGSLSWSVASAARAAGETEAGELASAAARLDVPRMSYSRAYEEVVAEYRAKDIDVASLGGSELDISVHRHMRSGVTVLGVLRYLWLGGMGVTALLLMRHNLRFARRLRRTRVLLEGAESRYPVYLCDDIPSPCLFGLFRPAVYVTSAAAKDQRTLGYVIAHEETHAKHLDQLWALLRCLCLAVWWFDPLVWLAAHVSRIDGELACDEGVLARLGEAERIPYGETLLALVPRGRGGSAALSATTMTAGKKQMLDRIRRIAEHKRPLAAALAAALILAGAVCACTFAGAKKEPEPGETAYHSPTGQPATPPDLLPLGKYESPGAYLYSLAKDMKEVTCPSADGGGEMTVPVLDTRVRYLTKLGELSGLAPEGALELYSYLIEVKPDAEEGSIALVGGMTAGEGGWYDLEGQGGHSLVLLRYADGSCDVLHDRGNNDDMGGLYYYEESAEEMLYDWYVRANGLDRPLYTLDLLPPDGDGNHPAHRRDGDGWYIYIPVAAWSEVRGSGGVRWVSQYGTASTVGVRQATRAEAEAERPKSAPGEKFSYIEGEDGRLWLVYSQYVPENITDAPEIRREPELLDAMRESFTLIGAGGAEAPAAADLTDKLIAAVDRVFGSYMLPGTDYRISVEAGGRRDEYAVEAHNSSWSVEASEGYFLKTNYLWELLAEGDLHREPPASAVLRIRTERDSFEIVEGENLLIWTEADGTEHCFRPEPVGGGTPTIYERLLGYAVTGELARPRQLAAVPGEVTDYAEVAWQISEQYAALLPDRPSWCAWAAPYAAEAKFISLFDAYYGEDFPNFCFTMTLLLDLDESNMGWFMAGPGAERIEGEKYTGWDHQGWYRWWSEVTVGLVDGQWRILDMGSGGAHVWLPEGVGWDFPDEQLSTEQLVRLYFLTWGQTHDWRLLHALAQKPTEEIRGEMEKLSEEGRYTLLRGMERYNENFGSREEDWYGSFDPDIWPYEIALPVHEIMTEVAGYGNDTLCVRVTDPGDSPLPAGFEFYFGIMPYSDSGYPEVDYPLGTRLEITYSGVMGMDEQGYHGLDGTLSFRRADE